MFSSTRVRWLLALTAACALLAGPVAIASASNDSIINTYNRYGAAFGRDQTAVNTAEAKLTATGNSKPLQRALARASAEADRFANALGSQSADTSRFRVARAAIVSGLHGISSADGAFSEEIKRRTVTKASVARFNREINDANKKLRRGEGLLPHV